MDTLIRRRVARLALPSVEALKRVRTGNLPAFRIATERVAPPPIARARRSKSGPDPDRTSRAEPCGSKTLPSTGCAATRAAAVTAAADESRERVIVSLDVGEGRRRRRARVAGRIGRGDDVGHGQVLEHGHGDREA